MKKKGQNSLTSLVEGKPCKNYRGKRQKNLLGMHECYAMQVLEKKIKIKK